MARELGVGAETFCKWVLKDEADRGEAPEKPTSAQLTELARLKGGMRSCADDPAAREQFFRPGGQPDPTGP